MPHAETEASSASEREPSVGRLSCRPIFPFGVEVQGDMGAPASAAEVAWLRQLLAQHSVLVVRGQQLDMAQQRRFNEWFGPSISEAHEPQPYISVDPARGSLGRGDIDFHRDLNYAPKPFTALSLHAIDVVDGETSTSFANTILAYRALPAELRDRIGRLDAFSATPLRASGRTYRREVTIPGWPTIVRPIVAPHPITNEPLLLICPRSTVDIEGTDEDREALLQMLFDTMADPANVYEHRWCVGDLVIWDNLTCLHARSPLAGVTRRTLQRVVNGEQSFFQAFPGIDLQQLLASALGESVGQSKAHADA